MQYKIIGDSCCDVTEEMRHAPFFQSIPLTLHIGEYHVVDDEDFDQRDFLRRVAASPVGPKTSCPSPDAYLQAYEAAEAEEIYVITLSEHLSGSYQSAKIAEQMFAEAHPEGTGKQIYVFSSDTATAGQCNLCMEIVKLKEAGCGFQEVVSTINAKIQVMQTYFVLESLDALRKNGRLTGIKAFLASALNIKPVMGADHGVIVPRSQQRGITRALKKMVSIAVQRAGGPERAARLRVHLVHVNCPERAALVKAELEKAAPFQDIVITGAWGVATVYASDGGIVMAL